MSLLDLTCKGHYNTSNPVAFLPQGSTATSVPSKKQKDKVDITRALQVHKCVFSEDSLAILEKATKVQPLLVRSPLKHHSDQWEDTISSAVSLSGTSHTTQSIADADLKESEASCEFHILCATIYLTISHFFT
jgi:hypothetical protein